MVLQTVTALEIGGLTIPEIGRVPEKRTFRTLPNGSIEFASQVDFPAIDSCGYSEDEDDRSVGGFELGGSSTSGTDSVSTEPVADKSVQDDDDEPTTVKFAAFPYDSDHPVPPWEENRFTFLPSARV
jgi:hypothetical protein